MVSGFCGLNRLPSGLLVTGKRMQMGQCGIKCNGKRGLVLERLRHEQTTLERRKCRRGQALRIGIGQQFP